jgi:hypothetical protein
MEYLYVHLALAIGVTLAAAGVTLAVVYTPYGYSLLDTFVTAVTGAFLQIGNLLVIASITAATFDALASVADVKLPFLVPIVLGYAAFHFALYRTSIAVTALQGTPYDPETALSAPHLRAFAAFRRLRSPPSGESGG